ncbi:MAG: hypothetical protein LBD78_08705 [Spirochaetaceae bacterium]|nr:hypothetical protein [Spirochaetaceae bacterium]
MGDEAFFTGADSAGPSRRNRRSLVAKITGLAFLVLILGLGGVFFLRSPVLLVTDNSFGRIYGGMRGMMVRVEAALKLFRPVKQVWIAGGSGPDMVVFAVEGISEKPFCVLFPYRYQEGARRYAERHPGTPAAVLTGRARVSGGDDIPYIMTNTRVDLYRAGRSAAVFAGGEGEVLLFQDESLGASEREAFELGLQDGGFERSPRYLRGNTESAIPGNTSVVVIIGPADHYLRQNYDIPVILFSWIDPELTRRSIKVFFDDSPLALAAEAAAAASTVPGEMTEIPSRVELMGQRISEKKILLALKKVVKADNVMRDLFGGNTTQLP